MKSKNFILILILIGLTGCMSRRPERPMDPYTRVTLSKLDDYVECVRRSLTYKNYRNLQTKWRMIAQFSVEPNGSVKDPKITNSDFEETPLHHCVVTEISRLVFPGEAKTVQVKQLLDLDPEKYK